MPSTRESGILTLAAIRKSKGETQYFFNEKQRVLTLAGGKAGRETAALLREALRRKLPLKAQIDTREGVIHRAGSLTQKELEEFRRNRILVEKPEKGQRVNVSALDPTVFNVEAHHRGVRCFRQCKQIIPNYKKAKKIFDFCAKQTCSLGGPFQVSPCIPFQYVIDGCYARAHKMRWVITQKYHYCCEKIFAFANQGSDTLAVQANKWGGCCVFWWYHVAPLVRVRLGRWAAGVSRRASSWIGDVEFPAPYRDGGVWIVCDGDGSLFEGDAIEGRMESRLLVLCDFSRDYVSGFPLRAATAWCARACAQRIRVVADDSLGSLGRPTKGAEDIGIVRRAYCGFLKH